MNPAILEIGPLAIPVWAIVLGVGMISYLNSAAILVYAERRIAAFIQNRVGPNRVGPFGLLQWLL